MGHKSFVQSLLYNTSSISTDFEISNAVYFDNIKEQQNVYNFSKFPFFDYTRNYNNTSCRDNILVETLPVGHPVFIFGDGEQLEDTKFVNSIAGITEGSGFASNRYIKFNRLITGDSIIRFCARPAKSSSNLVNSISRKMSYPPVGSDRGLHVQYSADGVNWFSANKSVFEQRRDKNITFSRANVIAESSNIFNAIKSTAALSEGYSKISFDDFDINSEWQQYAFCCDAEVIFDEKAPLQKGYHIRIVQEGYAASYSDNWAITNLTIESKFSHGVTPQIDEIVNLIPISSNFTETWDNFVDCVNDVQGHDGEIFAEHIIEDSLVRLNFRSPVGIISDGVTAGQRLTASIQNPERSLVTNYGFAHSMSKATRIKLISFDGGGTSKDHNTHFRLGIKEPFEFSKDKDAMIRLRDIINTSKNSYDQSKILTAVSFPSSVDIYSNFNSDSPYRQENPKKTDGTFSSGWSIDGFTDFQFSKSIGFFGIADDSDFNKNAASRIAKVINDNSSVIGIRAYLTSTLTNEITVEHVRNNNLGSYCEATTVKYITGSPDSTFAKDTSSIVMSPSNFTGGIFGPREIPVGCTLQSFGRTYLGTSPRDLEYYQDYGIRGFLDITDTLELNSEFASKVGGRTPKCMIDDFVVWARCLSTAEINAIYSSTRGAFGIKSGLSNFDPRIQIRDRDNNPGIYPTNARTTDKDFKGNFKILYSADQEIVSKKVFATAELIFYKKPLAKSFITLTDWRSNTKSFQFIASNKDKSSGKVYITIESTLEKTLKNLVDSINSFGSGTGTGFGINASLTKDNKVICTQTGVGVNIGYSTGNTQIVKSSHFSTTNIALIPDSFEGSTFRSPVEYPDRVPEDHPIISRLVTPGHARANLVINAPPRMSQESTADSPTSSESISPYKEDLQFGAFGASLHEDADTNYVNKNLLGANGDFWTQKNDIPGIKKSGPAWAKHKIEIDLEPVQKTLLFKHTTTGSTTAYFNFINKIWEPIGTISTGSYRSTAAGSNAYASCRLIVNQYHFNDETSSPFQNDILTDKLIFILEDSFGKSVSFKGINYSSAPAGQNFKRFSKNLYGVVTTDPNDLKLSFYDALNTAFLLGDLNIKPEISDTFSADTELDNFAIDLVQIDLGTEGNKTINFPGTFPFILNSLEYGPLSGSLGFFPVGQASFTYSDQINAFQGGDREEKQTASFYGRQTSYNLTGTEDPRDANFRRWLDTSAVGFGPSIGIRALRVDNINSNVEILSGALSEENKYVLLDGGISNPVTTFGFPFHPKFHATGSQALNLRNLIDRPFLIEKIAYQFRANLYESASIQTFVGGDTTTSSSYGAATDYLQSAFINIPTPTFFLLNQRKCALPFSIVNDLNVISLSDEEGRIENTFQYTASIPSNFYLTSMSNGSGQKTLVSDTRDLVTFARFASVPHAFSNDDFEPFVADVRKNLDLVLVPDKSIESQDDKLFIQEAHPEASFTIVAPVRAPKKSISVSSFRTESDFFGSKKTSYEFSVDESLMTSPIKKYSDAIILEDAAGTVRRFIFVNGTAASVTIDAASDFIDYSTIDGETITLIDAVTPSPNTVTFEFRTDVLLNNPIRIDGNNYYVGIQNVTATSGATFEEEICKSFASTINLAFANGDLDVFTEYTAGTVIILLQGRGGEEGNTSISTTLPWSPSKSFEGGQASLDSGATYVPFGVGSYFDTRWEGYWAIPVNENVSAAGGAALYASKFYAALSIANRESVEYGGFAVPFELQATGTTALSSFIFKQSIGGQRGMKNIAGTEDFEDAYFGDYQADADGFERYATLSVLDEGLIQNDTIQLDWSGNRTGIPTINSGRAPFGGENGSIEAAYRSNDGSGVCTIQHGAIDSLESPYLLMPDDNLIFGWQSPIGTGSHLYHAVAEEHGSFEILPGAGKIVLYGSILQNNEEKTHVTSNHPLTSEAVHEDIFSDADVHDIYDTEPYIFHFGNSLDQFVDGVIEMNTTPPQFTRRIISKATEGTHAIGPRDGSYPIFSKRASFLRGRRLIDSSEVDFDSMVPSLDGLMSRDNIKTFNPGYDDGVSNSKTGVIIIGYPSVTSSVDLYDNSKVVWNKWMSSFPFESKYEGVSRTLGLKLGITNQTMSGSTSLGLRPSTHVWFANSSTVVRSYYDTTDTQYQEMLNNIEKPRLFIDSDDFSIDTRPQPYNINYAVVTDESGEGPPGEELVELDFSNKYLGTKIGPRSRYFFERLFYGSGEGTFKFPKTPYWKNVYATPGQGFDLNETFPVTRGVIIRGFKYGLSNVTPVKTSAIYRTDRFGHLRDQLEQRPFIRSYRTDDATSDNTPVIVQFRSRNTGDIVDPAETNSANLSLYCTSSIPYDDGAYRDRFNLSPDDRNLSIVSYTVT